MRACLTFAVLTVLCVPAVPAMPVAVQCSDGSPPPCRIATRATTRRPPPAAQRARHLLLLPFRNVSRGEREEWLVSGSPLLLADALGRFRELTIVPDEHVVGARRRLGIPGSDALDAAQVRRLANETGGWTAVTGNVIASGSVMTVSAQAVDVVSGAVLKRAEVRVPEGGDVRSAYGQLGLQLLEAAGLPAHSGQETLVTTSSIDAWRAYARGMSLLHQSSFRRASEAFAEAVAHDSTFALAWARLASSLSAWNIENLVNPFSPAYRAVARASALLPQLPPQVAMIVRGQQHFMVGRIGQARAMIDSILAADPDQLEALEMGTAVEMLDPVLRPGSNPPTRRGSMNLAVARTRRILELDPGRRYAYSVLVFANSLAGGLWGGSLPAVREERGSFASMLMRTNEITLVHVLRDTFAVMTDSAFRQLPATERDQLRRRGADGAQHWVDLWLAAGPADADAHVWASRVAELRGEMGAALRHTAMADSLGAETGLEDIVGRRLTLLLYDRQFARAGALADSLAAAGRLRPSVLPVLDRKFASGVLALLATGRFDRAAEVAAAVGPGGTETGQACEALIHPLRARSASPPPGPLAREIADSIVARAEAFAAVPGLRPCRPLLDRLRSETIP